MVKVKNVYAILLSITLLILGWSLWRRPVHVDDAWFAEYVYWFAQLGYLKSECMRGFLNAENKLYIYHKLFIAEGAGLVKLFGFHIYPLKSFSLVMSAISVFPLHQLYRRYTRVGGSFLLLLALYFSFFHMMNLAFVFRPELQLVVLGLFSYLYLDKYFEEGKSRDLYLSAFISAIAIASHLNGMIFTGAAVLLLWIYRRWKHGFFYGVVGALGIVYYLTIDVRSIEEFHQLVYQFKNWRDVATANYGWTVLIRVFQEQGRFLHSPPELIYTAFLLFVLIPGRKLIQGKLRRLLGYAALLSICLAEIAHGSNTNYLIYAFPFFLLTAVLVIEENLKVGRLKSLTIGSVAFFLLLNWAYNISKFKDREYLSAEYQKIADVLPTDVYVLVPWNYVMQGLGKQKIQAFVAYRDKVENNTIEATPEGVFNEAFKYENEFVIFDQSNLDYFKVTEKEYAHYRVLEVQPSTYFTIYQRIP